MWHEYFSLGRAATKPEQIAALICREFGWTYEEYLNSPAWFIKVISAMLHAEAEEANRRVKRPD